ncbi:hypothetical protein FNF29_05065 [Cafeteria roenbergensis]|uniref:ShKT domain-containing protein n=1 Tax=Cafeteria roenbergensis TaxID=33653 RepID=A0A5A8CCU8_CAFRO|nr:hypothetical protein FNF29_05065 [Cafeteria roenbergensis]|eukprot:KAA0150728.1 hypothetical protein FNF29_05065 [Cafeteria roenbergensis]
MTNRAAAALLAIAGLAAASAGQQARVNGSSWVHDIWQPAALANKTLLDITLPGTHDSATFTLQDHFAPGSNALLEDIVRLADKLGINAYPLVIAWATAQNITLKQQLDAGARFIDLRACWSEPSEADPSAPTGWHTFHMVLGLPIAELLDQIAAFLDEAPGGEVVVVEVTHLLGSNATTQAQLRALLEAKLGDHLVRGMQFNATLQALTQGATKSRVLVLLEDWDGDGSSTGLWPDALIRGEYANQDNVPKMAEWDQGLIETLGGTGHIFRLWWTLTENVDDIVAGVLDPSKYPTKLFDLVRLANAQLAGWAAANRNYTLGNLLVVDDFENSPALEIAVADALRNCLDDPQLRARSPSGDDCRSWGIAGDCAASGSHGDFVRAHCRRTCLQC